MTKLARENTDNTITICDYITSEETEFNINNPTKDESIKILFWLSNHYNDEKFFKEMDKQDILDFLDYLRKPISDDHAQRWMGPTMEDNLF